MTPGKQHHVAPAALDVRACFNCHQADDVTGYSFDLDLPTVYACPHCVYALSMGDTDLLRALASRKPARGKRRTVSSG